MATSSAAPTPNTDKPNKTGKGKPRVTYAQRALILAARRDSPDAPVTVIASAANVSPRHVYRVLAAHHVDGRQLTADLMHTALTERLDEWAEASRQAAAKGYHQPAKDWLVAAKAIDEPRAASQTIASAISVSLAFALPGIPTNPTTIDVASPAQTIPTQPSQLPIHTAHASTLDTPQSPQITAPPPDIAARATAPQAEPDLRPPEKPLAGERS